MEVAGCRRRRELRAMEVAGRWRRREVTGLWFAAVVGEWAVFEVAWAGWGGRWPGGVGNSGTVKVTRNGRTGGLSGAGWPAAVNWRTGTARSPRTGRAARAITTPWADEPGLEIRSPPVGRRVREAGRVVVVREVGGDGEVNCSGTLGGVTMSRVIAVKRGVGKTSISPPASDSDFA
ncbi:hypothetical protein GCM10009828_078000 [Actinoplanes couchii]